MLEAALRERSRETWLVLRARRGDHAAYEELVQAHEQLAYRVARLVVGTGEAEEVVQAAFLNAFRALHTFRVGVPFRPWLLGIVANEGKDVRRHAHRQVLVVERSMEELALAPAEPSPVVAAVRAETRRSLLRAVSRLPAKQRDVVICRYLLDLSEQETAAVLAVARGTVKSRLSRALTTIRAELAPDEAYEAA